jgi:hypothetical protein
MVELDSSVLGEDRSDSKPSSMFDGKRWLYPTWMPPIIPPNRLSPKTPLALPKFALEKPRLNPV